MEEEEKGSSSKGRLGNRFLNQLKTLLNEF